MRLARLVVALVLLAPGTVLAQAAPDGPKEELTPKQKDQRARELFLRGERLYDEGDYEGSVSAWEEAFELSERPLLLFNLANAYERLGRYEAALKALRRYSPDAAADEVDIVRKRIAKLEARAEKQRKEDEERKLRAEEDARRAEEARNKPEPDPTPAPVAPVGGDDGGEGMSGRKKLAYGSLGVGAVAVGAGILFGVKASGARGDAGDLCESSGGSNYCPQAAKDALDRDKKYSLFADLSMGVGLAALGVGAYMLLKPGDDGAEKSSETNVAVLPSGAAVQWLVRF